VKTVNIIIPHDWGLTERGNLSVSIKAERLISALNNMDDRGRKRYVIKNFFISYFRMNYQKIDPDPMNSTTALRVFEYAVDVSRFYGIYRDDIEIIWREVFRSEIWEYTKNFFQFSKKWEQS
jgi:hypothetical protein